MSKIIFYRKPLFVCQVSRKKTTKTNLAVRSDRCLAHVVLVVFLAVFVFMHRFICEIILFFIHLVNFDRFISRLGAHCRRAGRKNDWTHQIDSLIMFQRDAQDQDVWNRELLAFFSHFWLKPFHSIETCLDTVHMAIIRTQPNEYCCCWIKVLLLWPDRLKIRMKILYVWMK